MKKRGLSPIIASVLLIMIVVILAAIIFIWAFSFVGESVGKFGSPIEKACGQVKFSAGIFLKSGEYEIDINNQGDVPLYGFNIKRIGEGEVVVKDIEGQTVGNGESVTLDAKLSGNEFSPGDEVLIVPIILGEADNGKVAYNCPDNFGYGITI